MRLVLITNVKYQKSLWLIVLVHSIIIWHYGYFTANIEIWKKASNTLSLHTLILFSKITMVTVITLKCSKCFKYTGFRLYYYLVMWALFPSVMSSRIETTKTHSFHFFSYYLIIREYIGSVQSNAKKRFKYSLFLSYLYSLVVYVCLLSLIWNAIKAWNTMPSVLIFIIK